MGNEYDQKELVANTRRLLDAIALGGEKRMSHLLRLRTPGQGSLLHHQITPATILLRVQSSTGRHWWTDRWSSG